MFDRRMCVCVIWCTCFLLSFSVTDMLYAYTRHTSHRYYILHHTIECTYIYILYYILYIIYYIYIPDVSILYYHSCSPSCNKTSGISIKNPMKPWKFHPALHQGFGLSQLGRSMASWRWGWERWWNHGRILSHQKIVSYKHGDVYPGVQVA